MTLLPYFFALRGSRIPRVRKVFLLYPYRMVPAGRSTFSLSRLIKEVTWTEAIFPGDCFFRVLIDSAIHGFLTANHAQNSNMYSPLTCWFEFCISLESLGHCFISTHWADLLLFLFILYFVSFFYFGGAFWEGGIRTMHFKVLLLSSMPVSLPHAFFLSPIQSVVL